MTEAAEGDSLSAVLDGAAAKIVETEETIVLSVTRPEAPVTVSINVPTDVEIESDDAGRVFPPEEITDAVVDVGEAEVDEVGVDCWEGAGSSLISILITCQ